VGAAIVAGVATPFFSLPRPVLLFGLVSLLNDTASEMIAPLLPLFLIQTLGAGAVAVGLVEGVAEAAASLLKGVSGRVADRTGGHGPLVVGGYVLSNLVRPSIGLASTWGWVLGLRFLDRVGKGVRTSPRDALIAGATEASLRGRAFGFHRALDHTGAVAGPLIGAALLAAGVGMRSIFLLSVVPGVVAVAVVAKAARAAGAPPATAAVGLRWRGLDRRLRGVIVAAATLALATPSEAFLVLWARDRGMALAVVPLLWAAAHAVKAAVAIPAGSLSDRFGRRWVVAAGWGSRVVLFITLALAGGGAMVVWSLFLLYAACLAATEGAERAVVGDLAPPSERATAYGIYHLAAGVAALPGGLAFGFLWQNLSPAAAFFAAALLTATAAGVLVWSLGQGGAAAGARRG